MLIVSTIILLNPKKNRNNVFLVVSEMEIIDEVAEIVKHVDADVNSETKCIIEIQKAIAEVYLLTKLVYVLFFYAFRSRMKRKIWVFSWKKN